MTWKKETVARSDAAAGRAGLLVSTLVAACTGSTTAVTPAPPPATTPTPPPAAAPAAPPAEATGITYHRIAAGEGHTCVIARDGTVWCWGRDSISQSQAEAQPAPVPDLEGARALFAGDGATCATTDRGILCWGSNFFGQLRMPPSWDYVRRPESWIPLGNRIARQGAIGIQGACSIDDGVVTCWGEIGSSITPSVDSRFGPVPEAEQGKNEISGRRTTNPRRIPGIDGALQVAIGINHLCALMPDGTVRCLGSNQVGQLGRVVMPLDSYHPAAPVEGLRDVVQIEAGLAVTCARTSGGDVYCWGSNRHGQLGARDEEKLVPVVQYATIPGDPHDRFWPRPIRVEGLPKARQLSVGAMHVCAVGDDARVYCWGANTSGQLGDGTTERRGTPVVMREIVGAVDVAAAAFGPEGNTCVLLESGRVKCVGRDDHGESGSQGVGQVMVPAEVKGP
jgi:alpha-tubulin suppressor-like RCC1 family protein